MRLALASAFLLVVAATAPDAGAPGAAPATAGPDAANAAAVAADRLGSATGPRCSMDILHPIEVEALGAIQEEVDFASADPKRLRITRAVESVLALGVMETHSSVLPHSVSH